MIRTGLELLVLGFVIVAFAVPASIAAQDSSHAENVACISLARDIHEYSILWRDGEATGWPLETNLAGWVIWNRIAASPITEFKDDADAWDFQWQGCYSSVLKELEE